VTGDDEERVAVAPNPLVLLGGEPDRLGAEHVVAFAEIRHALERWVEPQLGRADPLVRVAERSLVLGACLFVPGRHEVLVPRGCAATPPDRLGAWLGRV
jgi:hypothetical protein